jgi:hypothetical protein
MRVAFSGPAAPPLDRTVRNLAQVGEWLWVWGTAPLCVLALAGIAAALPRRHAPSLFLVAVALVPIAVLVPTATTWYPRYLHFVAVPALVLAAHALVSLVDLVFARRDLSAFARAAVLGGAAAVVLVPSLANDVRLWTDPARARMPAVDRFQYVSGWPSGYGVRETVERVKEERARHPEGLTIVIRSRAMPATQMALSVAFRRDAGVRIEDLPLEEPARTLPLLEEWARERPTVVVATLVDGGPRLPSGTWGRLGVELVAETHKPDGQPCDAVYRVKPLEAAPAAPRRTTVAIVGDAFHIDGRPTLEGRTWRGHRVEGLLPNSRMVQGVFDDRNPGTRGLWAYPDTKTWDPERNTREFVAAMGEWRRRGLLAFTLNLQGGSPQGYSKAQPWRNSAIEADGSLRPGDMARVARILDEADRLGMAVILGLFYFGQDQHLRGEAAVVRAVDETVAWVLGRGYRNVVLEISNECDGSYDHEILKPARAAELIERVKRTAGGGRRLLASTSFRGDVVPTPDVVRASDFVLLHGNGVADPKPIVWLVAETRKTPGYTPKPIVFNEDDHYDFDRPWNNFVAATSAYASWGFFDYRRAGEGFEEGYQSVPVSWGIASARKKGFFDLLSEMSR